MVFIEKQINKYKTLCENRKIEWIIVHYPGCVAEAENICKSMAREKPKNEQSSTHYIVDDHVVVHCVDERCFHAWHCSVTGKKVYCKARNNNSIGIDLCVKKISNDSRCASDSDWYFTDDTLFNAADLISRLMKEYNIDIDHVVRHYDVTHKRCPAPFVGDDINRNFCISGNNAWNAFKAQILSML